jgi:hypothetical protein
MKTRTGVICSLFLGCLFFVAPASAQQVVERDVCRGTITGEEVRGPAIIRLKNVNVIRYNVQVSQTVSFTAGPDLTLPFIPPVPKAPAQQTAQPAGGAGGLAAGDPCAPATLSAAIKANNLGALVNCSPTRILQAVVITLNDYEADRVNQIQNPIDDAIRTMESAKGRITVFVTNSDSLLCTLGPSGVLAGINGVVAEIDLALGQNWPHNEIAQLQGRLNVLNNVLNGFIINPSADERATIALIRARIAELQSLLTSVNASSESARQYQEARVKISGWKDHLMAIRGRGEEAFTIPDFEVGCGFAFDRNKRTKVEIIMQDRLAAPGTPAPPREIVTVVCSSPLSVSAGFGFSMNDEMDIAFVQSTKTVTDDMGQPSEVVINRFGFRNRSSFRTLPVILLNTRLYEPSDLFAVHASVGAAVDIKSGDAGTDVEYIVGPSVSFWRSLFITGGLHIGREQRLVGGFEIGDEVPMGIDAPPIEKEWKRGVAVTFTFKIR